VLLNTEAQTLNTEALLKEIDVQLIEKFNSIKQKERDQDKILSIVLEICSLREYNLPELSAILKRDENWISRKYIKPLLDKGKLEYKYPDMINHPHQAYKTAD
jgi:ATP-dependent DNA helicase RecG